MDGLLRIVLAKGEQAAVWETHPALKQVSVSSQGQRVHSFFGRARMLSRAARPLLKNDSEVEVLMKILKWIKRKVVGRFTSPPIVKGSYLEWRDMLRGEK
jgi:hypothetical protein